jgi:hypothetical protein
MADVVRWVDTKDREEVKDALHAAGLEEALIAAEATWGRDERQRSSIYTTAETVLQAYADPGLLATSLAVDLTPTPCWTAPARRHTCARRRSSRSACGRCSPR